MNIELVSKDELRLFEAKLLNRIEELLKGLGQENAKKWYKTKDLEESFGISKGKQQELRNKNILPFTKIGSTIYYSVDDIEKMLQENKSVL